MIGRLTSIPRCAGTPRFLWRSFAGPRTGNILLGALIFSGASCREPASARYEGAIHNTTREVRGTGHLTIFSRADSSISGYLRTDTSLRIVGRTVGWMTPTGWHLQTNTASGDTILWRSDGRRASLEGAVLGGSYTVIAGPSAGEIGTFEWNLITGRGLELPAQRSTFASSAGMRAEAPTVFLAAVLSVVFVVVVFRWVKATPFRRSDQPSASVIIRQLDGVNGWMAWFLFGQCVTTLMMLVRIREVWAPFQNGTWLLMGPLPGMRAVLFLELAVHVAQVVVPLVGFVLTVRQRPEAPRLWFAYLTVLATYAAVDMLATTSLTTSLRGILGDAAVSAERTVSGSVFSNARVVVFCGIWLAYWARSQRVLVTFGGQALTAWRIGLTWPWKAIGAHAPLGRDGTQGVTAAEAQLPSAVPSASRTDVV